jgi:hypothetical protein
MMAASVAPRYGWWVHSYARIRFAERTSITVPNRGCRTSDAFTAHMIVPTLLGFMHDSFSVLSTSSTPSGSDFRAVVAFLIFQVQVAQ